MKPPIAITGSFVASWTPAALFAPTIAATQRYDDASFWRSAVSALLGVPELSRPPRPPPAPPTAPNRPGRAGEAAGRRGVSGAGPEPEAEARPSATSERTSAAPPPAPGPVTDPLGPAVGSAPE